MWLLIDILISHRLRYYRHGRSLTRRRLGDLGGILDMEFSFLFLFLVSSELMIMPSGECNGTFLMRSQRWFRWWFMSPYGVTCPQWFKKQVIIVKKPLSSTKPHTEKTVEWNAWMCFSKKTWHIKWTKSNTISMRGYSLNMYDRYVWWLIMTWLRCFPFLRPIHS